MTPVEMFGLLAAGHALADYPLQGDFVARGKNRALPIPGVPWYQILGAHAVIHGAFVGVITGIWWLGLAEACAHAVIDDAKCTGKLSFNQDQTFHIICKGLWLVIVMAVAP